MTLSGANREYIVNLIELIRQELAKLGLQLKDDKTRIANKGGQQRVTGVVVNSRISPPRKLRRQIRAMFHQSGLNPTDADVNELRGYLSYLNSYDFLKESNELESYWVILRRVSEFKHKKVKEVMSQLYTDNNLKP
jgi:retron-type reverse transcriptase